MRTESRNNTEVSSYVIISFFAWVDVMYCGGPCHHLWVYTTRQTSNFTYVVNTLLSRLTFLPVIHSIFLMYNNLLLYSYIPLLKLNTRNLFFPFMTISSSFLLVFGYLSSRYTFSTCVVNISSLPSLALFSSFLWLLQLTCSYMVGIISSIFWILTELFKKLNLFFESFNRTKGFSFISTSGIIFV